MENQSLTNKDFVGNALIKDLLFSKSIKSVSHAFLIYGEEGLGKKTLAKFLAYRLMFDQVEKNFAEENDYKLILENKHPDLLIYGEKENIKINDVRELIKKIGLKPNQARYRVCLLLNCDSMTVPAQNALLKALEEPPEGTKFILTTKSKESLLQTILSRVQALKVNLVDITIGTKYILDRYENVSNEDVKKALTMSNGNIGRALEFLNLEKKNQAYEIAFNIIKEMADNSKFNIAAILTNISKDRVLYKQVLDEILKLLDEIMVYKVKINDGTSKTYEKITEKQIVKAVDTIVEVKSTWVYNPNLQFLASFLAMNLTITNF